VVAVSCREIAQIDGSRLVAEVVPGGPFVPKVDSLHEQVLRGDEAVIQHGSLGVEAGDEPSALEQRKEPELTEL